jgi:hypothetical protein
VPPVQRQPGGRWRVLPDLRSLVRTGPDGGFSVDVPPGGYYLCATGNTPRHLKSCEWGSGNRYIPVKEGERVQGITFIIRSGILLNLLFEDPSARLLDEKRYNIGVLSAEGFYARARPVSRTGAEAHLVVAVPRRAALRLYLGSEHEFTRPDGAPVPSRRPELPIAVGDVADVTVRLRVR